MLALVKYVTQRYDDGIIRCSYHCYLKVTFRLEARQLKYKRIPFTIGYSHSNVGLPASSLHPI